MAARLLSSPLQTERRPDGRRKVLRELRVDVDGKTYKVRAGRVTDYSSIPQPFAWLVRWSKVDIAGVVHDDLYKTGEVSRREADRVWRELAMAGEHSANPVQAWIGWLGLRIGGWYTWRKYRR